MLETVDLQSCKPSAAETLSSAFFQLVIAQYEGSFSGGSFNYVGTKNDAYRYET